MFLMNRKEGTPLALGLLLLASCLAADKRGTPLYPAMNARPERAEVAELRGYVAQVDGVEVPERGKSFELLPGCHVVGTPTAWGQVASPEGGGWVVKTGHHLFALPMKAGYQYLVDLQLKTLGDNSGHATIVAVEKDLEGKQTRTFNAATSNDDILSCQRSAGK